MWSSHTHRGPKCGKACIMYVLECEDIKKSFWKLPPWPSGAGQKQAPIWQKWFGAKINLQGWIWNLSCKLEKIWRKEKVVVWTQAFQQRPQCTSSQNSVLKKWPINVLTSFKRISNEQCCLAKTTAQKIQRCVKKRSLKKLTRKQIHTDVGRDMRETVSTILRYDTIVTEGRLNKTRRFPLPSPSVNRAVIKRTLALINQSMPRWPPSCPLICRLRGGQRRLDGMWNAPLDFSHWPA